MQWTPWMGPCSTGANCECRWPAMGGLQILIMAAAAVVEAGGVEELPGARGVAGGAVPGAGAGLVPAAVPATADQDPAPTLVPSLAHPRERSQPSPRLVPAPGPSLGAEPLRPTEGQDPDPGPRASPNPPQIMVARPHRHQTTDEDTPESTMRSKTSSGETLSNAMISWCQRLLLYLVLEASCLSFA